MNIVALNGRITATPELRYTASNTAVCSFTIAVNRKFKNPNGEYDTDFINCVAFRSAAELIGEYISKGDLLGISGRIQTRDYENKDGKRVYVTEVIVDQVDFLQQKKKETSSLKDDEVNPYNFSTNEPDDECDLIDFNEQLPF